MHVDVVTLSAPAHAPRRVFRTRATEERLRQDSQTILRERFWAHQERPIS